jgi:isocitrate dehydrogenase kinase/phosphatase
MLRKRLIDLCNAIGFHRHGKTEFYRDFAHSARRANALSSRRERPEW